MKNMDSNTKVQVYNNINNEVSFRDAQDRIIEIRNIGQYKLLKLEDLDAVMSNSPAMLREGILYIKNEKARKYLDIDEFYKDGTIIANDEIEDLLKEEPEEVKKKVKKASESAKKEISRIAEEKREELTVGVIDAVDKATGKKLKDA